jgi:nitrite reductase/ring-hydroxylating ferredoxin subunit
MPGFVKLASLSELPAEGGKEVEHEGSIYALFRVEGKVFAIDGICPHQGGPLAEGHCTGPIVTCPWHGWQFDVRDGQNPTFSRIRQPTFAVRIDGDDVMVEVP